MTDTPTERDVVTYEADGDVAVIRIDDGKANALDDAVLDALSAAVHRAGTEAKAIALLGRPGRFSAGFHLPTIQEGPASARRLLKKGFELSRQLHDAPIPVVIGSTGHALAMGAILLMSADLRIGAAGEFKVGLTEVAIGMAMPTYVIGLAELRLSAPHRLPAIQLARITDPDGAVAVGFLDEVVPADEVEAAATRAAAELAATLHPTAFRVTRERMVAPARADLLRAIEADLESFKIER